MDNSPPLLVVNDLGHTFSNRGHEIRVFEKCSLKAPQNQKTK